jgi:hypothetical protein
VDVRAMVFVTKVRGITEEYDHSKVVQTCLRLHSTREIAEKVADRVEAKLYDGISTKEILRMIYRYLSENRPQLEYEVDLRKAISLLRSKPDFEIYVRKLLSEHGYKVEGPLIIRGRCVEHEIDAIATKDEETTYVEVKHHLWPNTYTGLDVFLEANSIFEDLVSGNKPDSNRILFNKALVVCNTKLSNHARRYADCARIMYIAWKSPPAASLEKMIEEKRLYPITSIGTLDNKTEAKLADAGVLLLRDLLNSDLKELSGRTGIFRDRLERLVQRATEITKA